MSSEMNIVKQTVAVAHRSSNIAFGIFVLSLPSVCITKCTEHYQACCVHYTPSVSNSI